MGRNLSRNAETSSDRDLSVRPVVTLEKLTPEKLRDRLNSRKRKMNKNVSFSVSDSSSDDSNEGKTRGRKAKKMPRKNAKLGSSDSDDDLSNASDGSEKIKRGRGRPRTAGRTSKTPQTNGKNRSGDSSNSADEEPQVKTRGRPRKNSKSPSKNSDDESSNASDGSEEVKKGRGRPRTVGRTSKTPQTNGKNRSVDSGDSSDSADEEPQVKTRGRPRKNSKSTSKDSDGDSSDLSDGTEEVKRGRGRPRTAGRTSKTPQTNSKSRTVNSDGSEKIEEKSASTSRTPRTSGRTVKTQQKNGKPATVNLDSDDDSSDGSENIKPKSKGASKAPRTSGRKTKTQQKNDKIDEDSDDNSSDSSKSWNSSNSSQRKPKTGGKSHGTTGSDDSDWVASDDSSEERKKKTKPRQGKTKSGRTTKPPQTYGKTIDSDSSDGSKNTKRRSGRLSKSQESDSDGSEDEVENKRLQEMREMLEKLKAKKKQNKSASIHSESDGASDESVDLKTRSQDKKKDAKKKRKSDSESDAVSDETVDLKTRLGNKKKDEKKNRKNDSGSDSTVDIKTRATRLGSNKKNAKKNLKSDSESDASSDESDDLKKNAKKNRKNDADDEYLNNSGEDLEESETDSEASIHESDDDEPLDQPLDQRKEKIAGMDTKLREMKKMLEELKAKKKENEMASTSSGRAKKEIQYDETSNDSDTSELDDEKEVEFISDDADDFCADRFETASATITSVLRGLITAVKNDKKEVAIIDSGSSLEGNTLIFPEIRKLDLELYDECADNVINKLKKTTNPVAKKNYVPSFCKAVLKDAKIKCFVVLHPSEGDLEFLHFLPLKYHIECVILCGNPAQYVFHEDFIAALMARVEKNTKVYFSVLGENSTDLFKDSFNKVISNLEELDFTCGMDSEDPNATESYRSGESYKNLLGEEFTLPFQEYLEFGTFAISFPVLNPNFKKIDRKVFCPSENKEQCSVACVKTEFHKLLIGGDSSDLTLATALHGGDKYTGVILPQSARTDIKNLRLSFVTKNNLVSYSNESSLERSLKRSDCRFVLVPGDMDSQHPSPDFYSDLIHLKSLANAKSHSFDTFKPPGTKKAHALDPFTKKSIFLKFRPTKCLFSMYQNPVRLFFVSKKVVILQSPVFRESWCELKNY